MVVNSENGINRKFLFDYELYIKNIKTDWGDCYQKFKNEKCNCKLLNNNICQKECYIS